ARNRSRVVDDLFHRNRQGIRLPLKNASYRVTDQEDIEAGFVQNPCKGIIVSGETGDLLPQTLFFDDMTYSDLISHCVTRHNRQSLRPSRKANNGERRVNRVPPTKYCLLAYVSVQAIWMQAVYSSASQRPYY